MEEKMKIGFVTPWFGMNIPGGAEAELRGLVIHLKDKIDVEILTTCVKEFTADWSEDFHEPGLTEEEGIKIRRFRVRKRNGSVFDEINIKLMRNQLPLSEEEESTFLRESVNSPDLYEYIRDHGDAYDLFVFIPYMFGTTYAGVQIYPEKSVMIPCLHDESYIYMRSYKEAYSRIAGMIFHSNPEKTLADKAFDMSKVMGRNLGEGVYTDFTFDADRFREKFGIRDPFILYAGRKDAGKRVDLLIRYFCKYKNRRFDSTGSSLKLVLIGGGKIDIPSYMEEDILDLGFVDLQDKYDAYAAASLLCQPSEFESFSLVIMESWLAGRPVLVNEKCAVTTDFAKDAKGGLYFNGYYDFEGALDYLLQNPAIADQMGQNGCRYIKERFAWDIITETYIRYFEEVIRAGQGA